MILFLLIFGHFIADYPLQGEFLAKGKNHKVPLPNIPWYQCLTAHAFIHGGIVSLVTENVWFGLFECVAHWFIDYGKSDGRYGLNVDQSLHIVCKIIIFALYIY